MYTKYTIWYTILWKIEQSVHLFPLSFADPPPSPGVGVGPPGGSSAIALLHRLQGWLNSDTFVRFNMSIYVRTTCYVQ